MNTDKFLTPKEIASELDLYIAGQEDAKRQVAVAVFKRHAQLQLAAQGDSNIGRKDNVLMMGPSGVGKTEIIRRLGRILNVPIYVVDVANYTPQAFRGADPMDMLDGLVMCAKEMHSSSATINPEDPLHRDLIYRAKSERDDERFYSESLNQRKRDSLRHEILTLREKGTSPEDMLKELADHKGKEQWENIIRDEGELKDFMMEVEEQEQEEEQRQEENPYPYPNPYDDPNIYQKTDEELQAESDAHYEEVWEEMKKDKDLMERAQKILTSEGAVLLAERKGIIFIDEIDKLISTVTDSGGGQSGLDVQRQMLKMIEGHNVKSPTTGEIVKTHSILFIAAGAFQKFDSSDLLPELLGRFPIKTTLSSLSRENILDILRNRKGSALESECKTLREEGIQLKIEDSGYNEIADCVIKLNEAENLGARRIHEVLSRLFTEMYWEADGQKKEIVVDEKYVKESPVGKQMEELEKKVRDPRKDVI